MKAFLVLDQPSSCTLPLSWTSLHSFSLARIMDYYGHCLEQSLLEQLLSFICSLNKSEKIMQ
jgi:hypothetical protein